MNFFFWKYNKKEVPVIIHKDCHAKLPEKIKKHFVPINDHNAPVVATHTVVVVSDAPVAYESYDFFLGAIDGSHDNIYGHYFAEDNGPSEDHPDAISAYQQCASADIDQQYGGVGETVDTSAVGGASTGSDCAPDPFGISDLDSPDCGLTSGGFDN